MSRDKKKTIQVFTFKKKCVRIAMQMQCFYELTLLISSLENIMKNAMVENKKKFQKSK